MIWWRPAEDTRGCYGYWFLDARLDLVEMSRTAARAIYQVFNFRPAQMNAANDRDGLRW